MQMYNTANCMGSLGYVYTNLLYKKWFIIGSYPRHYATFIHSETLVHTKNYECTILIFSDDLVDKYLHMHGQSILWLSINSTYDNIQYMILYTKMPSNMLILNSCRFQCFSKLELYTTAALCVCW